MNKLSKKEQLDVLKETIDIRDYLQDHGYTVDKSRNTARHAAFTNEATGDKLVVPTNGNKQLAGYFFNQYDKQDKGSIIDFAMSRQNKSLDEAREYILQYQGGGIDQVATSPRKSNNRTESLDEAERNKRVSYVVNKIASDKGKQDLAELEYRFLSKETIQHKAFEGKIKAHQFKGNQYVAFIMQDETLKTQGIVLKNRDENKYLGKRNGVFISNPTNHLGKIDALVVSFENPIEGLSHFQKEGIGKQPDNYIYLSTAGNPGKKQLQIIHHKINELKPSKIILLNDRDKSGLEYDRQLKKALKDTNIPIQVKKPTFKDWNADLAAEQMYKSRFLNKNIRDPEHPYPPRSKVNLSLMKAYLHKDYEQMNTLSNGRSADNFIHYTINNKQVQFTLKELAIINNDRKSLSYFSKEKDARTVNNIRRANAVSSPTLVQPVEKLPQLKSDVQRGITAEKALKLEQQSPSSRQPNPTLTRKNMNAENDPQKAFAALRNKYNQEIDAIQKQIQGKPEFEKLAKRLRYYREYPHLGVKKIDQFIKMEDKRILSLDKQIQKTPKTNQQEIKH